MTPVFCVKLTANIQMEHLEWEHRMSGVGNLAIFSQKICNF